MVSAEMLSGFPLLAGQESTFLEKLALIAQDISVNRGEWVFHEGENAAALYLISRGKIKLRFHLDRTRNLYVDLKTLGSGEVLGWSALVPPYFYSMGAMASEDTHLVRIEGEALRTLIEDQPEEGYALMQGIAQTMATRLTVLSEQAPGLSLRLLISLVLYALSALAIFALIVLAILAVGSAVSGHPQALSAFPAALPCVIIPTAVLVLLARSIYPREKQHLQN